MSKIVKIIEAEIKNINDEAKTLEVVVSTESRDSDGDIILRTAFSKHIKRYKSNPVLLNSHNYRDVENIIGKALNLKSTEKGLVAKFEYFVGQGNSAADWAFQLAKNGIAAFSIGFAPVEYEFIEEKTPDGYKRVTGRKYKQIELLEISQVTVPANRDAVLQSRSQKSMEIKLLDKVNKAFEDKTIEEVEETEEPQNEDTQKEETKQISPVYEEILLGQDSGTKEVPKSKKPQSKYIPSTNSIDIKIDSSEVEQLTKEILK